MKCIPPFHLVRRSVALLAVTTTALVAGCSDSTAPRTLPISANADVLGGGNGNADLPHPVNVRVLPMSPNLEFTSINGIVVYNGGYGSALDVDGHNPNVLYSMTDRGPNVSGTGNDKLFAMPAFHPQIGVFKMMGNELVRQDVIVLKDASGTPLTGLPPAPGNTGNTSEVPKALDGSTLPYDPNGIDSEGLRVMPDGSFWVSDEYGPFLTHFDKTGRTLERNSPTSGPHPLPMVLLNRQPNKGMEGLASIEDGRVLVGMMQNPLNNPKAAAKNSKLLRIVFVDVTTGKTKQFGYMLDQASYGVSEITAISPTRFLVLERDGKFLNDAVGGASVQKKIYLIDITGATDISDPANTLTGLLVGSAQKTLEQLTDAEFALNNIVPVRKALIVDMLAMGYTHDKAEGMTLLNNGTTIAVSNDDDFGVTDDGAGHLLQKLLPSGKVDHNELWLFHLSGSLYKK